MISNNLKKAIQNKQFFNFSVKKAKMELTLRTPYKTYFDKFDGFSRIIAKTNEAALVVQNRSPASMYVLPPGQYYQIRNLKVKLLQDSKDTTGDLLHLGGWLIVHADNSCEINLLDAFEKKDIKPDLFDKADIPKDRDDPAGKYASKLRKSTAKIFTKKGL